MSIEVTSPAFDHGDRIPEKYTEDGADVSPPLSFSGVPEEAKELVLICDDPDAPTEEPWVHWLLYKIPAGVDSLPEGIPNKPRLQKPPGALQGKNSWKIGTQTGYRGPAPPRGGPHRYFFHVYAVNVKLVIEPAVTKKVLLQEIGGHVIAEGEL
ncbi:MAG: YbhB/YbcL family Raf kinase inhibitor-like protein, partial [Pirellulales bacterium]